MIRPILDRIVVTDQEASRQTASGIVLAGNNIKPNRGVVVGVGPGTVDDKGRTLVPSVSEGDIVVYVQEAGTVVEVEDMTYRVLQEKDILGIIRQ